MILRVLSTSSPLGAWELKISQCIEVLKTLYVIVAGMLVNALPFFTNFIFFFSSPFFLTDM